MKSLLLASLLFTSTAFAEPYAHVELGLGTSYFPTLGDGTWYQDGFRHILNLSSPAITFGLTGTAYESGKWSLDWHADYVFLGHVSSDAFAVPSDSNYNSKTKGCNGACLPLAEYKGNGNVQGVAFTLAPTYKTHGISFSVEGGVFVFRPTWHEDIYNWFAPGNTLHVQHAPGIQVAPVVGLGIAFSPMTSLNYRYYFDKTTWNDGNPYPGIWKGTHLLSITHRW